jgi:hypothetical protein
MIHARHRFAAWPCAAIFLALLLSGSEASAQGPEFQSPGMSDFSTLGQTTRFSSEFNPALGFVVEGYADYVDLDDGENGSDFNLRLLELNGAAWVDPSAWAWAVITGSPDEHVTVHEAAVVYTGFEGNSELRVGHFFVDFGKQMQTHLHELRTLERPLVLRRYLGTALSGTGIQYDYWLGVGDSPVRFSLGAFGSLAGHHHGADDSEHEVHTHVPALKDIDEFSAVARLTGMRDVGEQGVAQLGLSVRHVPEFEFHFEADPSLSLDGMSNTVFGVDGTYGWSDPTGIKNFVGGFEFLRYDGDLAAHPDGDVPTELLVQDDAASGYFAYADYAWSQFHSAGVQYSSVEEPESPDLETSELDLYYTRKFTEFRRVRLGVTLTESDESGDDFRVYLQFTGIFGSHAHGLNW